MSRPVAITGLGTVGATGCGREGLAAALVAGRPCLSEVDRSAGYHRAGGARRAALVPAGAIDPWVPPREARRMSPPSKLALAACRMALADAGLGRGWTAPADVLTAVVVATAYGPSSYTEGLLAQILLDSPESASPFLFTESVANAPAAQIAIAARAHGAGVTVAQREVGPLLAVARAAAEVAHGRAEVALAGAVEEMTPLLHAVLDRFGALARPCGDGGGEVARPFDRRRDGFLAGEGATVLVLEPEERARRRGAPVLARLRGWGSAFDPTAPPTGWGEGHAALGAALRRVMVRAGVAPQEIGAIVSGASGSRAGDRLEALALRAVWEADGDLLLPPVLAPKGVTGEYGGGLLAAALLAAQASGTAGGDVAGPTAGFAEADPALGIVPHAGGPLGRGPRAATLVESFAAGGAAAWLILDAAGEPGANPGKVAR